MQRRVRVHRSDYDLQLALYPCLFLSISRRQRKHSCTFSIKAHVFRKRLREGDLMALRDEEPHSERIMIGRAGREALVRHIEERE